MLPRRVKQDGLKELTGAHGGVKDFEIGFPMECGGGKRLQIGNRLVTLLLQELHHFGWRAIGLRCDMLPVHLVNIGHRDGWGGRAFDHIICTQASTG
jgi:hypothetical protein